MVGLTPSFSTGKDLGILVRQYSRLANWEFGWGVFETHRVTNDRSEEAKAKIATHVIAVPLDGLLDYLFDADVVADRLQAAAVQLVKRWNQRMPRKALEWNDEICSEVWLSSKKKQESSVFELTLSTYGFHQANKEKEDVQITQADLKVCLRTSLPVLLLPPQSLLQVLVKLRTTSYSVRYEGPDRRIRADGYRKDRFGYNARLDHFLNLLRQPDFQAELQRSRDSHYEARRNAAEKQHAVPKARQGGPSSVTSTGEASQTDDSGPVGTASTTPTCTALGETRQEKESKADQNADDNAAGGAPASTADDDGVETDGED